MIRYPIWVVTWGLVMLSSPAYAHRPTMSDGTAADADYAIEFQDVQISRVVYHQVTQQAPRVWITFEVDRPQALMLQIGGRHDFAQGSGIDENGDAHAPDGLGNTVRRVTVKGRISGDHLAVDAFRMLP